MELAVPCDSVELRVYSSAMVCVGVREAGPQPAGWSRIPWPDALARDAGDGLFFYRVVAHAGGLQSAGTGRLVLLR